MVQRPKFAELRVPPINSSRERDLVTSELSRGL